MKNVKYIFLFFLISILSFTLANGFFFKSKTKIDSLCIYSLSDDFESSTIYDVGNYYINEVNHSSDVSGLYNLLKLFEVGDILGFSFKIDFKDGAEVMQMLNVTILSQDNLMDFILYNCHIGNDIFNQSMNAQIVEYDDKILFAIPYIMESF